MANDAITFDPQTLQKRIAERVKGMFSDLIPDAAFDDMVKREIAAYFEVKSVTVTSKKEEGRGYNNSSTEYVTNISESITPFAQAVRECFIVELKQRIKEALSTPEWDVYRQDKVGPLVEQVTRQLAPELVTAMFKGLVQQTASVISSQMHR